METAGGRSRRRDGARSRQQRWRRRPGDLQSFGFCRPGWSLWRLGPAASRCFEEGETMSRATYPLKLPHSIKKAAQRLAKEDGVSLNQWIAAAVAEKVGVVETAADFFKKRAGKATGEGLMKFLRTAPKLAPEPEDTHR